MSLTATGGFTIRLTAVEGRITTGVSPTAFRAREQVGTRSRGRPWDRRSSGSIRTVWRTAAVCPEQATPTASARVMPAAALSASQARTDPVGAGQACLDRATPTGLARVMPDVALSASPDRPDLPSPALATCLREVTPTGWALPAIRWEAGVCPAEAIAEVSEA